MDLQTSREAEINATSNNNGSLRNLRNRLEGAIEQLAETYGPRERRYLITINDTEGKDINDIVSSLKTLSSIRYCVAGEELAPTTGHKHWHLYIHFIDRVYFSRVRSLLRTAHVDECHGTEFDNYRYVVKEKKIYEEGSCTGKTSSYKDKIERLVQLMSEIKTLSDEELESKYLYEFFNHYNKINDYKIRTHSMEQPWEGGQFHLKIFGYGTKINGPIAWYHPIKYIIKTLINGGMVTNLISTSLC